MTKKRLYEAGALVESRTDEGTWPIRIITEGKGSSGVYTRELLEKYKDAFADRPMFGNHPDNPNEPWKRSPFEMKAQLGPNIEYKVVDGVAGLYGEAVVDEEVDKWLTKFHKAIGVSIFASGDGREENGEWIVESFDGSDPYTSVDFVVAPGRGGGVESRVLEAFRALEQTSTPEVEPGPASAASRNNNKEHTLEIEELALKVDALVESVTALTGHVGALAESLKPEPAPEVDVAAAVVEAERKAEEADIPVELRASIIEAAKTGKPEDVTAALEAQKAVVQAVSARLTESAVSGVFGSASGVTDHTELVKGW